jgi:hypothetical protein
MNMLIDASEGFILLALFSGRKIVGPGVPNVIIIK